MLLAVNTRYTHFIVEFKTANFKTHIYIWVILLKTGLKRVLLS